MKKIYTLSLLLACTLSFGQVTVPFYEPFNYVVTSALQGQNNWGSLNSGDDLAITSGSLTPSTSLPSYPSSLNEKLSFGGAGIDASKQFAQQTSGTVYYSFLLRVNDLTGTTVVTGGYIAGLVQGVSTTYGATLWLKNVNAGSGGGGTDYNIGVNPRTTAANTIYFPNNITPTTLTVGQTYLVVIANEIVSGTVNDKVRIWVNPTVGGASEPSGFAETTNILADLTSIDRMLLRQGSATDTPAAIDIDELRVATTWADATTTLILNSTQFDAISGLKIYPNPAKNLLNITSDSFETKTVAIYNVLGAQVLSANVTNAPINVASLSKGVYVVKVTESEKTATRKLVIE